MVKEGLPKGIMHQRRSSKIKDYTSLDSAYIMPTRVKLSGALNSYYKRLLDKMLLEGVCVFMCVPARQA